MEIEIRLENLALFEAHSSHWELLLVVDRLELPLQELISEEPRQSAVADFATLSRVASAEFVLERIRAIRIAIGGLQSALEKDLTTSFGNGGQSANPSALA